VNFQEGAEQVRKTVRDRGYVAPVLLDGSGDVTGRVYGVWGPPTSYFIDRRGRLVGRITGARDWNNPAARQIIQSLLSEPAK
jgi:hypothetical protein